MLSIRAAVAYCVGAIIGMVCIQFAPIQVDVQMRTKEKGFLQYFINTGAGFNEAQSKRIQLTTSPDFSHYKMSSRIYGLRAIRIDPLETQGQFEILGLQINYLFWQRQWHGHGELKYLVPVNEIDVKSTEGAVLFGHSTGNDPSLVTTDVEYLKHWKVIATIFSALIGGVAALLLFVVIKFFGGLNAVKVNKHAPLITIVTTAVLLRIIYWSQSVLPSEPNQLWKVWPDEWTHFSIAEYIMNQGMWDYFFAEQSVMAAPGNPIHIALMYTVINSVNFIRAVNLSLSALTIVLLYKLGKKLFNKPVGLLAAGICAVHGQLIQYSSTLLSEPLFLFFFIAGIYYLLRTLGTPNQPGYRNKYYVLVSAVFLTMAILTRPVAMLLPVFLLAVIGALEVYLSWRVGKPSFPLLKRAALSLLLPIFFVGIVATKNYVCFERFMVASGAGAVLWLGSRADTEGDEPPYRRQTYDTQMITHGASHISIQGDILLMEAAKKNIRANPISYAWWSVKRIGRLVVASNLAWFYPYTNIAEWYRASGRNTVATINIIFQITLASSIAVYSTIGFVVARKLQSESLVVAATAIYLVVFSVPFMVNQRLGLPLVTLLVIPAAAVVNGAWIGAGNLRWAALIGMLFVFAVVLHIIVLC